MQVSFDQVLILFVSFMILFVTMYYLLSLIRALSLTDGVPTISTFGCDIKLMKQKLKLDTDKSIIDLWCGNGNTLRFLVKTFNLKSWTWYDVNSYSILFGKIRNYLQGIKNITMKCCDFVNQDIRGYDYIYLYLLPWTMAKIQDRVFENMDDDTVIVVNTFEFPDKKPYQVIKNWWDRNKIFLYKKQ